MFDCKNLVHPFQNDPGCSQSQRVMEDLLNASTKIDGRTLADLLNYFVELSSHIKYTYATQAETSGNYSLKEANWESFFAGSNTPFILASASKNNSAGISEKLQLYNFLLSKNPTTERLQLLLYYFYFNTIYRIDNLYSSVQFIGLPVVATIEAAVKNKLQVHVTTFIRIFYTAHKVLGVKLIDFTSFFNQKGIWNIATDVTAGDEEINAIDTGRLDQIVAIQYAFNNSTSAILQAVDTISASAAANIQQSLTGLKEELNQRYSPHLALLFTFLNIFRKLQDNLNGYTKKHLDFFYQTVLRLTPRDAQPDKVHIVFELQKQLKQYALKKGLLVKADKDKNGIEIDFAIDDDIVVNKTQVADIRTLFLNNGNVYDDVYVEGAYMALKANTADGIDRDFTDDPKNYPTLGGKYSKYIAPGKKSPQKYPSARIGFVLASNVLLLNEGERTIDITLNCTLKDNCSTVNEVFREKKSLINPAKLFTSVKSVLSDAYLYINSQLINQAKKQGLDLTKANLISNQFLREELPKQICCAGIAAYKERDDATILREEWDRFLNQNNFTEDEQNFLFGIFKPFKPFRALFSGEKGWIEAANTDRKIVTDPLSISITGDAASFVIQIIATIHAGMPAITFYNKDVLLEDLGSISPLVKIDLNDNIKLALTDAILKNTNHDCCFENEQGIAGREISLYHFFRDTIINDSKITVKVCGLKNFIVQNDESVQDVNSPIYPFGTRPAIIDFDAVNSNVNSDSSTTSDSPDNIELRNKEITEEKKLIKNLVGPNFYVGSAEIFSKKWNQLCVNLNWKDKPGDFNEYYKAYLVKYSEVDGKIKSVYGLNESDFEVNLALLSQGEWIKEKGSKEKVAWDRLLPDYNRNLFPKMACDLCAGVRPFTHSFYIVPEDFGNPIVEDNLLTGLKKYDTTSRKGFVRFTMEKQDFLHKDYAFVLGRQMMALGRFPDVILENAVYLVNQKDGSSVIAYQNIGSTLFLLEKSIEDAANAAKDTKDGADALATDYATDPNSVQAEIKTNKESANTTKESADTVASNFEKIQNFLKIFDKDGKPIKEIAVLIPNEPWTPIISNMELDYTATADSIDITLIHLYPYKDTYKQEALALIPSLFPSFCDEGTLFIGLSDLMPGSNVNLLFQLAEATSDTELDVETVSWKYLSNNQWFSLRTGFEILEDGTENLTTSGIIQFSLPGNISADNTIMPKSIYWIKAAVPLNSRAVSETFSIQAQAMEATFVIDAKNDTGRLSGSLEEGSVSKLKVADANIKQVLQPYPSFGGSPPELTGDYYTRVSELLRHKGRAIQKFDYERIVLQAFPQIFKTKCINHSFFLSAHEYDNDFPVAPGYVLLAVIPDLTKLMAAESFEPKVPESIIEDIQSYLCARTSPFVKIKAVNPRYEKINICLSLILREGYDKNFYKDELMKDLREFLAPWAVGIFDKLRFGQCVNKSDLVYFLETREYVDYITRMSIQSEFDKKTFSESTTEICPLTPRSILLAGDIQVCFEENGKQEWKAKPCDKPAPVIPLNKEKTTILL
jgi:hypothetical protein